MSFFIGLYLHNKPQAKARGYRLFITPGFNLGN
jgi:hypothetical protein